MKYEQVFISTATEVFKQINPRSMFIVIKNYKNNYGEVATHSLCWHVSYINAVVKAYDMMSEFQPDVSFCAGKPYALKDLKQAHDEWLESLGDTLVLGPGNNPRATSAHAYDLAMDEYGIRVPGVKIHYRTGKLHLTNVYRINKIVHVEGNYPQTSRARKTLAKRDLRNLTPLRRWGQFVLYPGRFEKLTVNHLTIKEQDVINSRGDQISN